MKHARALCGLLLFACFTASAAELATARPESVGMSSQRLRRLTNAMKALTDEGKLAGVVTMVAKDGKVVHCTRPPASRMSRATRR